MKKKSQIYKIVLKSSITHKVLVAEWTKALSFLGSFSSLYVSSNLTPSFVIFLPLTLKEAGGVQNDPMVFQLATISHRIMLWSQKFLTVSINILSWR